MTYRGHVQDGAVVLDEAADIANGTEVQVIILNGGSLQETPEARPSLYDSLKPFIGMANDLPDDASHNHDHYLYGTPKK